MFDISAPSVSICYFCIKLANVTPYWGKRRMLVVAMFLFCLLDSSVSRVSECFYFVSWVTGFYFEARVSRVSGSVQMWFQSLRNQSEREPSHCTKHPHFKPIGSSAVVELHKLTHPEWVSVFCLPSDWFGANVISKLEKSKREGNDSISQTFSNPTSQWSLRLKFKHRGNMCVFGSK